MPPAREIEVHGSDAASAALVPWPLDLKVHEGALSLGKPPAIAAPAELAEHAVVLGAELASLTGLQPEIQDGDEGEIVLELWEDLGAEEYLLEVGAGGARVSGADLQGVARGTSTLLQLLDHDAVEGWRLPALRIRDEPEFPYRAAMVDCARHFQSIDVLRRVVDLCRFYKVKCLQLHLADDESFTFPSRAFPNAPTPERTYPREALVELDRYAAARGVGIIPELDVPGHSRALVKACPEVFGLADRERNGRLVHIGREAAYEGIDRLIGELCEVFDSSPWIHVGGDESGLEGVAEDPEVGDYMRRHGIGDVEDLQRHFLTRVHEMVAARGRSTLMWEGFRPGGRVRVPEEVTVVVWDCSYHRPEELAAAGHPLVNASWQPLYVVGGGREPPAPSPRMWPAEEIYAWHARRWQHFERGNPAFEGLEVPASTAVRGGQMCVWEQREHTTVRDLRSRLPAFAERLWNPAAPGFPHFHRRWLAADARATALMRR